MFCKCLILHVTSPRSNKACYWRSEGWCGGADRTGRHFPGGGIMTTNNNCKNARARRAGIEIHGTPTVLRSGAFKISK